MSTMSFPQTGMKREDLFAVLKKATVMTRTGKPGVLLAWLTMRVKS